MTDESCQLGIKPSTRPSKDSQMTSPYKATVAALLLCIGAATCQFEGCFVKGVAYKGQQISTQQADTPKLCQQACYDEKASCKHWTWKKPTGKCMLFMTKEKTIGFQEALGGSDESHELGDVVSGPRACQGIFLISLYHSLK